MLEAPDELDMIPAAWEDDDRLVADTPCIDGGCSWSLYTLRFFSGSCKEEFAKDLTKAVLDLKIQEG